MFRPFQRPKWCRYALSGATASWSTEVEHDLGMGGRLPALDKQTATGTRPAPAPARGRPRVAEEFPHRRNCPTPQKEGRSQPLRTTQPGSGGSADHRGGAPCCAGPRLNGRAYQYESNQEVLGGRGSALGQATRHWGGQIACPSRRFPTPMRVSYPDTARRTRKGPAAGNWSAKRAPRARAHSPGPLGISARSAASRSGTS